MITRADLDALQAIGLAVPLRITSLVERCEAKTPGVALVGQFSRGKSKLFNDLVGAQVSEVGALPTTAILLEAETGAAQATAVREGDVHALPLDAEERRLALEAPTARPDRVSLAGAFRLPVGVRLVDTPGTGAISNLGEKEWWLARAGSAVLVLGLPPGPQAEDWGLLAELAEVFGDDLLLALKATDAEPTGDDLAEVARVAARNSGRPVLVLPQRPPVGEWGVDPAWRAFEQEIDRLADRSARRRVEDLRELDAWAESLPDLVGGLDPALLSSDAVSASQAHPGISSLTRSVLDDLTRRVVAVEEVRAAAARAEADRVAKEEAERARERAALIASRRTAGQELVNQLNTFPGSIERFEVGRRHQRLQQQVESWLALTDDGQELADLRRQIERRAGEVAVVVGRRQLQDLVDEGEALFIEPVEDVVAWEAARQGFLSRAVRRPPALPSAVDLDRRVAGLLAEVNAAGPGWGQRSGEHLVMAERRVRSQRSVGTILIVFSILGGIGSLLTGCAGAIDSALSNTGQGYSGYPGTYSSSSSAGQSLVSASIVIMVFSGVVFVVGLIIRINNSGLPNEIRRAYVPVGRPSEAPPPPPGAPPPPGGYRPPPPPPGAPPPPGGYRPPPPPPGASPSPGGYRPPPPGGYRPPPPSPSHAGPPPPTPPQPPGRFSPSPPPPSAGVQPSQPGPEPSPSGRFRPHGPAPPAAPPPPPSLGNHPPPPPSGRFRPQAPAPPAAPPPPSGIGNPLPPPPSPARGPSEVGVTPPPPALRPPPPGQAGTPVVRAWAGPSSESEDRPPPPQGHDPVPADSGEPVSGPATPPPPTIEAALQQPREDGPEG